MLASSTEYRETARHSCLTGHQRRKLAHLYRWLRINGPVAVAFSGGVDSSLLAYVAKKASAGRELAVTAYSEIYPERETLAAEQLALNHGINHTLMRSQELENKQFAENNPLRCYHCKTELYVRMRDLVKRSGYSCLIDGQNADDAKDFRPGSKAGRELGILSPLQILGFTKNDIRAAAKYCGLEVWNKPPHPCLSTRFPYGTKLEKAQLKTIDSVESFLASVGFKDFRIRVHDKIARLEVQEEDFALLLDKNIRRQVIDHLLLKGYQHVTMDLEGLVSGSMNRSLKSHDKHQ